MAVPMPRVAVNPYDEVISYSGISIGTSKKYRSNKGTVTKVTNG
jgi:hypothetical protein